MSVHVVTRLQAGQTKNLGSVAVRVKIFLFSTASRLALWLTQPPNQLILLILMALPPRVKWLEWESDHSLPSNADLKNDGAMPPFPQMSSLCGA